MKNYKVRFPRKLKKRLVAFNGRGKIRICIMLGQILYETTGKKQYDLYTRANVYKTGWAVKKGMAEPFEMKK